VVRNRGARMGLEVWRDPALPNAGIALVHRSPEFFADRRSRVAPLPLPAHEPVVPPDQLMDCGGIEPYRQEYVGGLLTSESLERVARRFPDAVERRFGPGGQARVAVALSPGDTTVVGLKVVAPLGVEPGTIFTTHLAQHHFGSKRITGGVAVQVRVRAPSEPIRADAK
jgi:hypothetical protein